MASEWRWYRVKEWQTSCNSITQNPMVVVLLAPDTLQTFLVTILSALLTTIAPWTPHLAVLICYCQLLFSHLLQLILTSDLPSFLSQLQTSHPHAMLDYWSQLHHWTPQMRVVVTLSVHCWKLVHSCHAHDETWDHCNRTPVQILQESAQGPTRPHFYIISTYIKLAKWVAMGLIPYKSSIIFFTITVSWSDLEAI